MIKKFDKKDEESGKIGELLVQTVIAFENRKLRLALGANAELTC